jgi:cysteine synthase A
MPALSSPLEAIGNTPLIQLRRVVPENSARVLVKWEGSNPTGSYKDRMALAIIEAAERRGDVNPDTTVVEFTAGSTGSSLAFVCAVKGYRFRVVSSDAFAPEKLATMAAFGAEVELVPGHGQGISAELMGRMRERVQAMVAAGGVFWADQFNNADAHDGYAKIGHELLEQVDGQIDAFCGGVGTAGMLMGVSRAFREAGCEARVIALEPATSPFLTQGISGRHTVEGIAPGFRPPHLNDDLYDEARAIDEPLAREMTRRLAREEGIFTGASGGLNVAAAIDLARELGPNHTVVTIACDTGLKYLSSDLFRA